MLLIYITSNKRRGDDGEWNMYMFFGGEGGIWKNTFFFFLNFLWFYFFSSNFASCFIAYEKHQEQVHKQDGIYRFEADSNGNHIGRFWPGSGWFLEIH